MAQSDISSAVERAKAVAAKLTAAAKASGQLSDSASKRRIDDDPPTSGYSKRENLYGDAPPTKKSRDDFNDIPVSGYMPKSRPGLGSDEATNSFLAKMGLALGGGGGSGAPSAGSKITREITIPTDMVGLIIGRGGETLKRIQAETGVLKIQFNQDRESSATERTTTLIGSEADVEKAAKMIQELVSGGHRGGGLGSFGGGGGASHYGPKGSMVTVEVPGDRIGLVIGKGGETIRSLQQTTGARITVVPDGAPRQGFKTVNIQGTDSQIEESKRMIDDIVSGKVSAILSTMCSLIFFVSHQVMVGSGAPIGHVPPGQLLEEIKVPNDRVGLVIGKGGESCKAIQNQYGVKLQFEQAPDANGERTIKIYGSSADAIQGAISAVYEKAGQHRGGGGGGNQYGYGSSGYGAADPYATAGYGAGVDSYAAMASQYAQYAAAQGGGDYSQYYDQSQGAYYDPATYAAYAQQYAAAAGTTAVTGNEGVASGETENAAPAEGDEAANAAAWAAYYAYYAQYGGVPGADGSAAGAGIESAAYGNGTESEAPPGS
ncbi:Far upstream element-binding protein 1 [Entophlyctis luteolus]|nr:Far upstream element-binding protein 1 [Entophlyctis luteolus]